MGNLPRAERPGEVAMTEREIVLAALDRDDPTERAKYLD
jgi:hypothetical protein